MMGGGEGQVVCTGGEGGTGGGARGGQGGGGGANGSTGGGRLVHPLPDPKKKKKKKKRVLLHIRQKASIPGAPSHGEGRKGWV